MFPIIPSKTENRKQRRKLKIPSFPRRRESDLSGFGCFSFRNF
ncbi:hypothetical protein NMH_1553 [Neisseria meningitidis H44/76]|uniref:PilS cassette n=1 Tax=Neisseria meningitidis serogroup B / serotype 15 (strain H44/76) TaxID=909420 RepID=E6MYG9_NEIMH|nr:hypothetical protein NMH_1553 [Neisseria meningitidis H44/76]